MLVHWETVTFGFMIEHWLACQETFVENTWATLIDDCSSIEVLPIAFYARSDITSCQSFEVVDIL